MWPDFKWLQNALTFFKFLDTTCPWYIFIQIFYRYNQIVPWHSISLMGVVNDRRTETDFEKHLHWQPLEVKKNYCHRTLLDACCNGHTWLLNTGQSGQNNTGKQSWIMTASTVMLFTLSPLDMEVEEEPFIQTSWMRKTMRSAPTLFDESSRHLSF